MDTAATSLRRLLDTQRVGALGTLHRGEPAVSMVPFAMTPADPRVWIHVSALASHTADMRRHPRVSLLVMADLAEGVVPQALPRVALQADALTVPAGSVQHDDARRVYLARFPDAATTFELADFSIVALQPTSARLVAGFGRAWSLTGAALVKWLVR